LISFDYAEYFGIIGRFHCLTSSGSIKDRKMSQYPKQIPMRFC